MKNTSEKETVTITIPKDAAWTLHAFIDGGIGTSESDNFNREMIPIRKQLEKKLKEETNNE